MIISASYRSDIPAFHARWFEAALIAGKAEVSNPYSGATTSIDLRPGAVDGYVFWTRNPRPFAPALDRVTAQAKPAVFQFTILGHPRKLDRSVPSITDAVAQAQALARRLGPRALVWRYDPIILTPETETDWQRRNFTALARRLRGVSDEVIVSFAQFYAKSVRNLARAGIQWREPPPDEKAALAGEFGAIAADFGFQLTLCAQPDLAAASRLGEARCVDLERLSDVAGRELPAPPSARPNRPGCRCASARDIGTYDSCAHGCRYCYAVSDHEKAAERQRTERPG